MLNSDFNSNFGNASKNAPSANFQYISNDKFSDDAKIVKNNNIHPLLGYYDNNQTINFNENINPFEIKKPTVNHPKIDDNFQNTISDQNKSNYVFFNKNSLTFTFYDDNDKCNFEIKNVIKCISEHFDKKKEFLKNLDNNELLKSFIDKNIANVTVNKEGSFCNILIKNNSGFMNNISILIKLNKLLFDYKDNCLENDLSLVNKNDSVNIKKQVNKFVFAMINHTLKILDKLSSMNILNKIENSPYLNLNKEETVKKQCKNIAIKNNMLKYSVFLINKLSSYMKNENEYVKVENDRINLLIKNIKQTNETVLKCINK